MTPTKLRHDGERGMALLMVLMTFSITITACVSLARLSTTAKSNRHLDEGNIRCDQLLDNADSIILDWLEHEADSIVLDPKEQSPSLDILHDLLWINDVEHRIRISAWDQYGMIPSETAHSASPLRISIPRAILKFIDKAPLIGPGTGLDRLLSITDSSNIFPAGSLSEVICFGDALDSTGDDISAPEDPTVGAWIATHNNSPGSFNIHTTPVPLLEVAFRSAGRGGISAVVSARARGEKTTVGASLGTGGSEVAFVTQSDSWAFRIDVSVGEIVQSWWSVYQRKQEWRCRQRLAIP